MLVHLHVKNFTLVDELSLDMSAGLTVLTGETGAGKSILLDALHLALGDRADSEKIKAGQEKAEVTASFDIRQSPQVLHWLKQAEIDDQECILRRVVTQEGRSRAFINGQVVTLTQLRSLAELLMDIHSQHEHQSLLQVTHHRYLLDSFGKHVNAADSVKAAYRTWHQRQQALDEVRNQTEELNARYQLLHYQVEELDQLALGEGELEELENAQRQLENAVHTQQSCQQVFALCCDSDDAIRQNLLRAVATLKHMSFKSARVEGVIDLLNNAIIQVEEAGSELERELDMEMEEFKLPEIEQRLTAIYDIARKHRVAPEALFELHNTLAAELSLMRSGDDQLEALEADAKAALADYHQLAVQLTQARVSAAKKLTKSVNQQLAGLAMAHAAFDVSLTDRQEPSVHGQETVEFLISTVPGQPAKPLIKVASGGELSRISLAIQVVAAKTSVKPTLVFDEVDVGIGGATGDVVGKMLRSLGESTQVICVTHLAQVASKAHQHLRVEKTIAKKTVSTKIELLDGEEKVLEIARMMGGVVESQQSLAHAREMLGA